MNKQMMEEAMAQMPMSKAASGTGIMATFSFPSSEDSDEGGDYEGERSPRDPEILMNNLRGDMRSVDARYMELANMVGEQAAMDTPTEVLALMQSKLGAAPAPAGIGALPGASPPEQMPGGAGPFPDGGAEQAPPTPDGLPPVRAASGKFITSAARGLRDMFLMGADDAAQTARAADAAAGRLTMVPQPTPARLENVRGDKGRFTKDQFVTGGDLAYPTLTGGAAQGLRDFAQKYDPRMGAAAGAGSVAAVMGAAPYLNGEAGAQGSSPAGEIKTSPDGVPYYDDPTWGALGSRGMPTEPLAELQGVPRGMEVLPPLDMDTQAPSGTPAAELLRQMTPESTYSDYLTGRDKAEPTAEESRTVATEIAKEAAPIKSRAERIKDTAGEYSNLYSEMLGDDAAGRKTQALLLLAEAGFKFAGNARPTMAMALADSLSGVTKGMSALAAQKYDRDMKIKQLALSSAIESVSSEDKYAQAVRLQSMKTAADLWKLQSEQAAARKLEILKNDLERMKGGVLKPGAAGLRLAETQSGSFSGYSIDPTDPTVRSAVMSPLTLTEANPFVVNQGQSVNAMETDDKARNEIVSSMNSKGNVIGTLERAVEKMQGSYGAVAWFRDKANNLLVPVLPMAPDLQTAENKTAINAAIGAARTMIAKTTNEGRLSNQSQEWVNTYLPADATTFWSDPETNMKNMNVLITILKNERQSDLARLGYTTDQLVLDVPAMGTPNDPFVVPSDEAGQGKLYGFLANTLGKVGDSSYKVHLRMPNGAIQAFSPSAFTGK